LLLRRWNQRRTPFTSVPLPPIYIYIYIKYWWFPFLLLQPPTSQHSSLSPPIFSLGLPSIHKKPLVLSLLGWSLSLSIYIYIYIYMYVCVVCLGFFSLSFMYETWTGRRVRRRGRKTCAVPCLVGYSLGLWFYDMTSHN
jgi:hypothetical protein